MFLGQAIFVYIGSQEGSTTTYTKKMRITVRLCKDILKQIEAYSKFNPSPLSIKKFIDFGEYTDPASIEKCEWGVCECVPIHFDCK